MTTATTTKTATTNEATQTMTDAVKTNVEAGQKMVAAFTDMFTKGFGSNPWAQAPVAMPVAFEKMTKAMNGLAEANAKFVTEVGALMAETVRTNASMIERTGEVMVGTMTGKQTKPAVETVREIAVESNAFGTKIAERVTKLNAEHGQRIAKIMEETMVCAKTGCCNN